MALENDYEKLYSHWLEESQQKELTPLSTALYSKYNQLKQSINSIDKRGNNEVKNQLVAAYEQNIEYLLKDFSKIREIKIINAAVALQEIDMDNILEAEKLFYMNLVSAVKGFKKVKTLEKFDAIQAPIQEKKTVPRVEEIDYDAEFEIIQQEMAEIEAEITSEGDEQNFRYTLLRFTKKVPPLVGVDLLNYGPFEENDLANLPYKNAKILLMEKFAEKIDI